MKQKMQLIVPFKLSRMLPSDAEENLQKVCFSLNSPAMYNDSDKALVCICTLSICCSQPLEKEI